ncbi:glutamate--tRNA ligase [Acidaminobacter sp. JC074]|uniref:glutamate--tRNA ligase n=1 Tax=Acidaminobacter sp. JC074 TaxID=2530199 RepID=UPI001F0DC8DF|nr:glutamate--tRNA ligase [Acidaminobacter sp. JC074]MCH4890459.1 glutamate--tRNA ligase [Acidaminobacter sp. JC074]
MSNRVRFAPSPTGYVHVGSLRTALYDYMFARKHDGKYVLRIEDTDRTRLVDDAIENLINAFEWAGIMHDEGPFFEEGKMVQRGDYGSYIQSERLDTYRPYVDQLLESGHAYYCFCSKERLDEVRAKNKEKGIISGYDGHCRDGSLEEAKKRVAAGESYVVRLKMPEDRELVFEDMVRGTVKMNTADSDDQVLLKADGFPTYHMAVVVDDHLMGITHMIRGEEWLPSTPKQIILYEALGWPQPKYAHLPNILNTEKKKLSKRHDSVAVEDFKKKGYLPEALINFLALVGWSPEGEEEIMTLEEMTKQFSFERVSKSGGVFDVQKLNWMNNQYIKNADDDRLTDLAMPYLVESGIINEDGLEGHFDWVKKIVSLVKEKLEYMAQITDYVPLFIGDVVEITDDSAMEMIKLDHVPTLIDALVGKFESAEAFDAPSVKKLFKEVQKETGIKGKNLFMCTRIAVTGQEHGSDLMETIAILGKDNVVKRMTSVKENYC